MSEDFIKTLSRAASDLKRPTKESELNSIAINAVKEDLNFLSFRLFDLRIETVANRFLAFTPTPESRELVIPSLGKLKTLAIEWMSEEISFEDAFSKLNEIQNEVKELFKKNGISSFGLLKPSFPIPKDPPKEMYK